MWKEIRKNYSISDEGIAMNTKTGRVLKLNRTSRGYLSFSTSVENVIKTHAVHQEVALAFIPNPLGLPQVNHKWGDKDDNRATSLEWATAQENERHSFDVLNKDFKGMKNNYSKLTDEQVLEIRAKRSTHTLKELSEEYGVAGSVISRIGTRKIWTHI